MKKFITLFIVFIFTASLMGQEINKKEKKKLRFTPYGFINLNGIIDFNGLDTYDDFTTSEIPINPSAYQESFHYHMTARQTRLGANIFYDSPWGEIHCFVSGDFYTGNTGAQSYFHLRQAYIQYGHFVFGQHTTTFGNPDACPTTVDFEGPNSSTTLRNPMILYNNSINKLWSYSLAIEMRGTDINLDTFKTSDSTNIQEPFASMPGFVANINKEYSWGLTTLTGMVDVTRYFNSELKQKNEVGYGGALSVIANVWKKNHISLFAFGGKGVANYINDLSGSGYNGIANPANNSLKLINSWGGFIGYTQNWTEKWSSNFIFSYLMLEESKLLSNEDFKDSYYALVNVFYNPFKHVAIGGEYVWGKLEVQDNQSGTANRLQFLVQFNF